MIFGGDEILPSYVGMPWRICLLNNQDSMESKSFFFRGSIMADWCMALLEINISCKKAMLKIIFPPLEEGYVWICELPEG